MTLQQLRGYIPDRLILDEIIAILDNHNDELIADQICVNFDFNPDEEGDE